MAYVMTYTTLLEDLRRYLERGFTEESDPLVFEQLPRLITMAERRCATELRIQGFLSAVSTSTVAGQSVYVKPDRWRETVSMTLGGVPLSTRSYEYLRGYWPVLAILADTDNPVQFYADYDYSHWLVTPTPAAAQALEIVYYQQVPLLDESNQSNWLTTFAPNVLLYAALLEATPYLKNDARVQLWQGIYDRAAQAISGQDLQKILDRAAVRSEA